MGDELKEVVKSKAVRAAIYAMVVGCMANWFLFGFLSVYLGGMPQGGYLFGFCGTKTDELSVLDDDGKVKIVDRKTYLHYQTHKGKYYLHNHGEVTEVSRSTYRYVQIHGFISMVWLIAVCAFIVWMIYRLARAGKLDFGRRQRPFSSKGD